jgi:hypothetical protein
MTQTVQPITNSEATAATADEAALRGETKTTPDNTGRVTQIIGPVIDVKFEDLGLPDLYNALIVETDGGCLLFKSN